MNAFPKEIAHVHRPRKADPFRYWVSAAEARWRENPLYDLLEQQSRDLKLPFVPLREQKHEQRAEPDLDRDLDE